MAWSVEKTGNSVEEAVLLALDELQLTQAEVQVEVLEEGSDDPDCRRPYRVLVTPLEDADRPYYGDSEDEDLPEEQGEAADAARAFLENVLENFGTRYRLQTTVEADSISLDVQSKDIGYLIGRGGETLAALQYLVSLVANRHASEQVHTRLDLAGYRRHHEEALASLARRTAVRVARSGRTFEMTPMSAADRRVVHFALQDFAGVETHSEGEGEDRRVIIAPLPQDD